MTNVPMRPVFWNEIRVLLLAAMASFVYTIVVGILNGLDIVDFDQRRILAHVHGGTLGWLTLSVFAAALWLFGEDKPIGPRERTVVQALTGGAVVAFTLYNIAFGTTYNELRPILGIFSTAVIAGAFLWVAYRIPRTELGVPHWGFIAALGTSIVGGVLGILLGLQIATGDKWLPDGGEDAHPATMVVGFLVPVALGMCEWAFFFPKPPKATRLGILQMVFPFLGGIILMIALLLGIDPLTPVAVLLQIAGLAIFGYRMWPNLRAVNFMEPTAARHAFMTYVGLIFVIGLAMYFVIRYEGDFDLVPFRQLLALDHSQFILAVTNSIFAMLLTATVAGGRGKRSDDVIFWAVNIGIIGFAAGLLFDITPLIHTFVPIMGLGLLHALATYARRLIATPA